MGRKISLSCKSIVGLALLFFSASALNALAGRASQVASQPQPPGLRAFSPTPSTDQIAITPPTSKTGWQTYTDRQLNIILQYPVDWFELDTHMLRQPTLRCFGANQGERVHNKPQFCVDLKPQVEAPSLKGFASDTPQAQQEFFEDLARRQVGQASVAGIHQHTVVQHYQVAGAPAIEEVQTLAPGAEGTEAYYTVSVYINTLRVGLIRLSMHTIDQEQFVQHEDIFRQMLSSFSIPISSSRDVQAETTEDWAFLRIMGMPWRCGHRCDPKKKEEPRQITQDWNDHWSNGSATGAAIDFNAPGECDYNRDVLAPFGGTVATGDQGDAGYGKYVIIDAGNGWSVRLAHLKEVSVSSGSTVAKGQIVGRSDHTGECRSDHTDESLGSHIHLELYWEDGRPDSSWFNTQGNHLFSYRTEDFVSSSTDFYSNSCGPVPPATILYWDAGYGGDRVYFFGSGTFNAPFWFSDQASSLSLRPWWAVTLYEHSTSDEQWSGGQVTFQEGDEFDFSDDYFDNGQCVNDKVSSLLVFTPLPGDLYRDGIVNTMDYGIVIQNWGSTNCDNVADLDRDCDVDGSDAKILLANYGKTLSPTTSNQSVSSLSTPDPPGNVSFLSEDNSIGTAVVVSLLWEDNSDNEDGFRFTWKIEGFGRITVTADEDTTSSVIAVIPCEANGGLRTATASVSAFNSEGTSRTASGEGNLVVPTCSHVVYLPIIQVASATSPISYFDDFSSYPVSQSPAGWTEYGSNLITPTIEEVGGVGPEHRLLSFPLSPATYQEKYLIKDGVEFETGSVTTKVNFQINRDEAGLALAYNDPGNHIRVTVNPFWDDMTIWEVVAARQRNIVSTGRGNLPISLDTDYWLRTVIAPGSAGSGNTLTVYWSTDGNNFTSLLTVPDLAGSWGRVGYITWSYSPPHVHFDDFQVFADEGSAPIVWTDLGEAAPGEININSLIGILGDGIVGGTYGSGIPYLFNYGISSDTFSPKLEVPGTGAYVDRLALGSGGQVYVTTSRTFGQGNLASYDPSPHTFVNLGAFGDEYGHGLAVGFDGKIYVGTCCQGQFSIYDPQTQSWTYMERLIPDQRRITGLTVGSDGNIYGVTSRIWEYPPGSAVLFKFDSVSQIPTVIGTIWPGVHESWNIVANPRDGRIYGTVGYGMIPRLFVFDPVNPGLGIQDLGEYATGVDQIDREALFVGSDGKVYTAVGGRLFVYDPLEPGTGIVDSGPVGEGSAPFVFGTDGRLYAVGRTNRTHLVRGD